MPGQETPLVAAFVEDTAMGFEAALYVAYARRPDDEARLRRLKSYLRGRKVEVKK